MSSAPPPGGPDAARARREIASRRVRALLDLGRPESALGAARRAVAEDPRDVELLELLGLCLVRCGQSAEALRVLVDARAHAPDHAHLSYLCGFACRQLADAAGAEAGYREALRLDPDEPVYLRALAELLADGKQYEEALELARKAIRIAPERVQNHITLGYVASAAGQRDLARAEYRRALELDPRDAVAWNNLGCVELAAGDRLAARESFREALRLDPEAPRSQRNLQLVVPTERPSAIYDDFDSFLGEVVRELVDAGRTGASLRSLALAQAVGGTAVGRALTNRVASSSRAGRLGVATGAAVAAAAVRSARTALLLPLGAAAAAAGIGWLATARKVTPLRRRFAAHVARARNEWQRARAAWLDGKMTRTARDAEIDRLLERLAVALDRERGDGPDEEVPPDEVGR